MRELLARWWAYQKLRRGQCRVCQAPLRDDEASPYCSDDCTLTDAH